MQNSILELKVWCLALVVSVSALQSCSSVHCGATKTQYLEQFDRFFDEVLDEDMSMTDSKWAIYDEHFDLYMLDCYDKFRDDLTFADKQDVLTKAVNYYYVRYGSHMIKEIQNEDNQVSQMIMEELQSMFDDPNQLLREVAGEEWEEMIDDFINDLDKWKNRLEEFMKEDK